MYRLYEKVPKNDEYEYGLKLLDTSENPFKDGPCLVSMIALTYCEKEINAALNYGMEALRLKTNHRENDGIKLEDYNARILSISYSEPDEVITENGRKMKKQKGGTEEQDNEFAKKYLFPLIENDGKKIDVMQAMKNMRNVNFFTFCFATFSVLDMEKCLINRMNELGYTEEEIEKIQSQMCIISYASDVKMTKEIFKKEKITSTCIEFGDVNDSEIWPPKKIREMVKEKNTVYGNEGFYYHDGPGEHRLGSYIIEDDSLSTGISNVLSKAVNNSIENYNSKEFIPISKKYLITDIEKIIEEIKNGKSREEIENELKNKQKIITEEDIGKATINIETEKINNANTKMQEDLQKKQEQQMNK